MADCHMEINFCDGQGRVVFADWHTIKHRQESYWLETAQWGEIVVEERILKGNPSQCDGIRLAFRIDRPPVGVSKYLFNRLGQQSTFAGCLTQRNNSSGQQGGSDERLSELVNITD